MLETDGAMVDALVLVVLMEGVDEHSQALQYREEVAAPLAERAHRVRQAVERGVELLALPGQSVGERLDDKS